MVNFQWHWPTSVVMVEPWEVQTLTHFMSRVKSCRRILFNILKSQERGCEDGIDRWHVDTISMCARSASISSISRTGETTAQLVPRSSQMLEPCGAASPDWTNFSCPRSLSHSDFYNYKRFHSQFASLSGSSTLPSFMILVPRDEFIDSLIETVMMLLGRCTIGAMFVFVNIDLWHWLLSLPSNQLSFFQKYRVFNKTWDSIITMYFIES